MSLTAHQPASAYTEGLLDACMGYRQPGVQSADYERGQRDGERYCVKKKAIAR